MEQKIEEDKSNNIDISSSPNLTHNTFNKNVISIRKSINITNNRRRISKLKKSICVFEQIIQQKTSLDNLVSECFLNEINEEMRPIIWKIFLDILPINQIEKWESNLTNSRNNYYKKVKDYINSNITDFLNNSINKSQLLKFYGFSDESIIKDKDDNLFKDLETISIIKLDVDRTCQDIDMFKNKNIKLILGKLLYVWAKENSPPGYCQGMNEIAGTLLYSLYSCNHNDAIHQSSHMDGTDILNLFHSIQNEEHFEADIYNLFSEIMKRGICNLYNYRIQSKNIKCDKFDSFDKKNITLNDIETDNDATAIKKKIYKIFYYYLKIIDIELFLHLCEGIEPYIFMFRWILCIFNREINISNIAFIWDCILAIECSDKVSESNKSLDLIDFICVAMIVDLRYDLLMEDDAYMILSSLMHFPNSQNMKEIVNRAIKMRDDVVIYESFRK